MSRCLRFGVALLMAAVLSGCATPHNAQDPLEGFNRAMFTFNETVDEAVVKPAATVYSSTLPSFVQIGIGNFFGNLADVWTGVNNLLQGKGADGMSDVMRVAVNSTLGFGGVLDIGSEAGLSKHKEDFGQTLAVWGVKSGPYVVLPVLGSSTVRDTAALPIDLVADPWGYTYPVRLRNVGSVVRAVDQRSAVLDASNLVEAAALDKYEFIRDAYLQRRANSIDNGDKQYMKKAEMDVDSEPLSPKGAAEPGIVAYPAISPRQVEAEPAQQRDVQPPGSVKQQVATPLTDAAGQTAVSSDGSKVYGISLSTKPAGQPLTTSNTTANAK